MIGCRRACPRACSVTASVEMKTCCLLASLLLAAAVSSLRAEPIVPVVIGTLWEYERVEQSGAAVERSDASVQIVGVETVDGKELLKVETRRAAELTKTELLSVEETGILCFRRETPEGRTVNFNPPQTLVKAPLQTGARWELDDRIDRADIHQAFTVGGEEDVVVPAGTFRAFRLHSEQPWPIATTVDRWFAPATGVVKEVTTTRGPGGRLLSRVTLRLRKLSAAPAPSPSPTARSSQVAPAGPAVELGAPGDEAAVSQPAPSPSPGVTLEVAAEREGKAQTEFRSDAANIFVRWSGRNLPSGVTVRIAWVVEDVGDLAPPDFVIDETDSIITMPELEARFTLSPPMDGWAEGKYRVELYIDNTLMQEVKVTIRD